MAKKKKAHEPREYAYVRLWAREQLWSVALLLETQERASREGLPLDVVYYHYDDGRWITTKDLAKDEERVPLGLDPMLVLCPLCRGDKYACNNCGVKGPFSPRQIFCQDEECLTIAGAIVCAKCAEPVSFSGTGIVDLSGKKPVLNGWLRRMTDKDAELIETGKRPA